MLVHSLPLWPAGATHSLELAALCVKGPCCNLEFFDLKICFQGLSSNLLGIKTHGGISTFLCRTPLPHQLHSCYKLQYA